MHISVTSYVRILNVLLFCNMADVKKEHNTMPVKTYGDVIITLENCVIPASKLSPTPSVRDGLDSETEMNLRVLGCEFIQTAGILLKLPQVRKRGPKKSRHGHVVDL